MFNMLLESSGYIWADARAIRSREALRGDQLEGSWAPSFWIDRGKTAGQYRSGATVPARRGSQKR